MALTEGVKITDLTAAQVLELQNVLFRAGYNPGPIDGVWGPETQKAYGRFLTRNGYDVRGSQIVVKLMSQLQQNTVPELWQGVVQGGEVTPSSSGGTGLGAAAPSTAVATAAATPAVTAGTPAATPAAPAYTAPAYTPASDSSTEEDVRTRYPHLAYLLDHPEVKDVLLRATQGGWDAATLQGELYKTWWWKLNSANMRTWDSKMAQDPATAQQEWDQRTVAVLNLAQQLGAPVDQEGAKWLAGRILREGWSDEQLKRFLGGVIRNAGGADPGQVTDQARQIKALARSFLSTLGDKEATEFAVRIAEGSSTREAVNTMLANEAKARFTWLAPQIDAGLTPMDLFGTTRNAVAQMLEMDPEQIDLSNPMWSELTSPIQGEGGQVRSMNFYEAQRWARKRPEWRLTDNANRQASEMGLSLLKSMGMVK